jgi:hypothetical protein
MTEKAARASRSAARARQFCNDLYVYIGLGFYEGFLHVAASCKLQLLLRIGSGHSDVALCR